MTDFINLKRTDGKSVFVNGKTVTHVVEGIPGVDGETSVVHFSDTHSLRVNGRASKIAAKLAEAGTAADKPAGAPEARATAPKKPAATK